MISKQDSDFFEERNARQKIRFLIGNIRNELENNITIKPAEIIQLIKSLAKQEGLQKELIAWAEIRVSNNEKYPVQDGGIETLDALARVDDLIAEAGLQLKRGVLE